MRGLRENQQEVYFQNIVSEDEITDEYGNATGNYNATYGEIQSEKLCVAPANGTKNFEAFGNLIDYDRTATTSNTDCTIDEHSILWIDGKSTSEPHNYYVIRKAMWKNSVLYALREANVSKDSDGN